MKSTNAPILTLSLALLAASAAFAEPSPWTLGISAAAEGFGSGSGLAAGESSRLGIVLDPFDWDFLVPSLEASVSLPIFPWRPQGLLLGARADLRLFELRAPPAERMTREPMLYAPSLAASIRYRPQDGLWRAAAELRALQLRTGDGVYSFLSPGLLFAPGAGGGLSAAGYAIELFAFTHFYL